MAKKIGKTVCVYSAKGGVGKTTTILNLAGTYHKLGKKVLILDLDLTGGAIAVALNKAPQMTLYNMILDIENNNYNSISNYVTKYNENIDFLASPIDPRQAGKIDSTYIELILDRAILSYDVVLIDTNHIINELNLVLIQRVDNILFVTTNDPYDLKNQSVIPFKNYFSLYDIKNIIKNNIDYTLSSSFFIPDIDNYVLNGQIIILNNKCQKVFPEDYTSFVRMATDFLEDKKEEENNHEE